MNNYKLISIDLDGTLLDDNNEISKENLLAITKLKELGVVFAPCTGRSLAEILDTVKNNPDIRYIIYSNGSVVYDKYTNTCIKACLSKQTASELFRVLSQYDVYYTIRANGNCYIEKASATTQNLSFYNIIPSHQDVMVNYSTQVEDFSNWKNDLTDIEVVSIFFHRLEEKEKCRKDLSKIKEIVFVEASEYNFEIISSESGKGAGLASLSNLLGVDKESVIGVGDSGNDIPMMCSAGTKIAVSNATKSLKDICDKIICSNNEHAVDYILKNFILK